MNTVQHAINNRETENAIVITFRNWMTYKLYDTRKTPYDIPLAMADYPVLSETIDNDLTIIEI